MKLLLMSLLLTLYGNFSWGAEEAPQSLTLDGKLYASDNSGSPLLDTGTFKVQILDDSKTCVIYEETQQFDTRGTAGAFNMRIGEKVSSHVKRTANDSGNKLSKVFANTGGTIAGKSLANGSACTAPATAGSSRLVQITVIPDSDPTPRVMTAMELNSVPVAIVAERAESLGGIMPGGFLQVNNTAPYVLSQSHLEDVFTTTNYDKLTDLLAGSSTSYVHASPNGTIQAPEMTGTPASPVAGQIWYDAGVVKYWDGSATQALSAGSGITSLTIGAGLTPTGTITTGGSTIAVDTGVTAGKIVAVQAGGKLPALDGSDLTNVAASSFSSTGSIATSGSVSAGTANFKNITLTNGATQTITLQPAASITGSPLTFTLPAAMPASSGYVLSSTTGGVLSWVAQSSGGLAAVSNTASLANGKTWIGDSGGKAQEKFIGVTDIRSTQTGNAQFFPTTCTAGQTLTWQSGTDTMVCTNISLATSALTGSIDLTTQVTGTLPIANGGTGSATQNFVDLTAAQTVAGVKTWSSNAIFSGSVGIGTTNPGDKLDVAGKIRATHICAPDGTNCKDLTTAWTGGGGTVTDITAGTGLTGGTISGSGTIGLGTELAAINGLSTTGFVKRTGSGAYSTETSFALTSDVTGTLPIANGGTNSSTALTNNQLMVSSGGKIVEAGAMTDGQIVVGKTGAAPQLVTMSGDATVSNTGSVTLKNTGTAGTYAKVTTDAQGRVTSGSALTASDIPSLDWAKITSGTPTTLSGYGIADAVANAGNTPSIKAGADASKGAASTTGQLYVATDTSKIYRANGSTWDVVASNSGTGISALTGDVTASGSGSVAATVAKIQGVGVSVTGPSAAGQVLKYDGSTQYEPGFIGVADIRSTQAGNAQFFPTTCTAGQTLTWQSGTDTMVCTNISLATSALTGSIDLTSQVTGTLPVANGGTGVTSLPSTFIMNGGQATSVVLGTTTGGSVGLKTNNLERITIAAGGQVGIGTTVPTSALEVQSSGYSQIVLKNSSWSQKLWFGAVADTIGSFIGNNAYYHSGVNTFTPNSTAASGLNFTYNGKTEFWNNTGLTAGTDYSPSVRMVITNTGSVGIGTTSPGDMLHVNGKIRATYICAVDGTNCKDLTTAWTGGSGTVTDVTAGTGLTGGTISGSGTIGLGTELAAINGISTTGFVKRTGTGAYSTATSMDLTSDVTGTLPVASGGTNSSTALSNNRLMISSGGKIVEAGAMTDGQIVVGKTSSAPQLVTMSGDATVSATGAVTLKNTGTAGTYAKVTTDAQGRVTSGAALSATDIPSLDWAKITTGLPTTLSGYGITDAIQNAGDTPSIKAGVDTSKGAATATGQLYVATDTFKIYRANGTTWDVVATAAGTGLSAVSNTASLASGKIWIGDGTGKAQEQTMSSDATISSSGALTLKNTGTAGTYTKVITDAQGRVTSGSSPTTLSGYGITDSVTNAGGAVSLQAGTDSSKGSASVNGRIYIATDTLKIYRDNGTSWVAIASNAGTGIAALTGDVTASGSGSVTATVANVGGVTAANVASGATAANAATNANTASTIVKRDSNGDFVAKGASLDNLVLRGSTSGTSTLRSPAAAGNVTWILPAADGTNGQVLQTDGAGQLSWAASGGGGSTEQTVYSTPGTYTWTKPASAKMIYIECWGGGGSGGRYTYAGGGGGGAYVNRFIRGEEAGATETITVGAGGAAISTNAAGSVGGNSSFGTWVIATGGGGGAANSAASGFSSGGAGGSGTAGAVTATGTVMICRVDSSSPSYSTVVYTNVFIAPANTTNGGGGGGGNCFSASTKSGGASSVFGGGGGTGCTNGSVSGSGGTSQYAGSGGATCGAAGSAPGGGGAGAKTGNSGAGGSGQCIVTTW